MFSYFTLKKSIRQNFINHAFYQKHLKYVIDCGLVFFNRDRWCIRLIIGCISNISHLDITKSKLFIFDKSNISEIIYLSCFLNANQLLYGDIRHKQHWVFKEIVASNLNPIQARGRGAEKTHHEEIR